MPREYLPALSAISLFRTLGPLDNLVMTGTSFPRPEGIQPRKRCPAASLREEHSMDPLTSGTFIGGGSFRCARCEYALTLDGPDVLPECPGCGGMEYVRASLFSPGSSATTAGETQI